MVPTVISIASPTSGCGKSTVAKYLQTYGFQTVKFAGTLKAMLTVMLTDAGCSPAFIADAIDGDCKEVPIMAAGGKTARNLMTSLGTDWGRMEIKDSIWIDMAIARALRIYGRGSGQRIVFDDTRLPAEVDAIRRNFHNTMFLYIDREDAQDRGGPYEGLLPMEHADYVIKNNGSVGDLLRQIDKIILHS